MQLAVRCESVEHVRQEAVAPKLRIGVEIRIEISKDVRGRVHHVARLIKIA